MIQASLHAQVGITQLVESTHDKQFVQFIKKKHQNSDNIHHYILYKLFLIKQNTYMQKYSYPYLTYNCKKVLINLQYLHNLYSLFFKFDNFSMVFNMHGNYPVIITRYARGTNSVRTLTRTCNNNKIRNMKYKQPCHNLN
ncbi:unnamed protein product [Paramecium sonneborni]|uniref:Uncharacterized protein n=1 Tax=Paramecium sonneborni TaxID=65129 RepID=A0A8S1NW81_9CILI|nr:unnamed protein product [Paramecium sonneborni]